MSSLRQTVSKVNSATGRESTTTFLMTESIHPFVFVTISLTEYEPEALYIWLGL